MSPQLHIPSCCIMMSSQWFILLVTVSHAYMTLCGAHLFIVLTSPMPYMGWSWRTGWGGAGLEIRKQHVPWLQFHPMGLMTHSPPGTRTRHRRFWLWSPPHCQLLAIWIPLLFGPPSGSISPQCCFHLRAFEVLCSFLSFVQPWGVFGQW